MRNLDKKTELKVIKEINKNLSTINSYCQVIIKKYNESSEMSHKDYVYFVFSADILYRIKDIIFLHKKLKQVKNNFDSSLCVLSRSVVETFIYLKYLLSEEDKITLRLHSFICYTSSNDITMLNSIKSLGEKNKFIFSDNTEDILSLIMINEKVAQWKKDVEEHKNFQKDVSSVVENEIKILNKIEEVAKKYDKIKNLTSVKSGEEDKSLEWIYNYIYRFQCMSTHNNLRDKEKVFRLYTDIKKEPNNIAIIHLIEGVSKQVLELYN